MLSCDLAMAILRMRLPGCQDRLATFACHDHAFNECLLMCPADVGQDFAGQMNAVRMLAMSWRTAVAHTVGLLSGAE